MRRSDQRNVCVPPTRLPGSALIIRLAFTLLLLVPAISYAGPQAPIGAVPTPSFNPPSRSGNGSENQDGTDQGGAGSGGSINKGGATGGATPVPPARTKTSSGNQNQGSENTSNPGQIRLQDTALGISVTGVFQRVLGRKPSQVELQNRVNQLMYGNRDTRVTMQQMERDLLASDEYYRISVNKLYWKYLGRDVSALAFASLLKTKPRPALLAVEQGLIYSKEYAERWVGAQYRSLLRRCPTEVEYEKLVNNLVKKAVSYDAVLADIRRSPEAARVTNLKTPELKTPCVRTPTPPTPIPLDQAFYLPAADFEKPQTFPTRMLQLDGTWRYYLVEYENELMSPKRWSLKGTEISQDFYDELSGYPGYLPSDDLAGTALELNGSATFPARIRHSDGPWYSYLIEYENKTPNEWHIRAEQISLVDYERYKKSQEDNLRREQEEEEKRQEDHWWRDFGMDFNPPRKRYVGKDTYEYYYPQWYEIPIVIKGKVVDYINTHFERPISKDEYEQFFKAREKVRAAFLNMRSDLKKLEEIEKQSTSLGDRILGCLVDFSGVSVDDLICRFNPTVDVTDEDLRSVIFELVEGRYMNLVQDFEDNPDKYSRPVPKRKGIFGLPRSKEKPDPLDPLKPLIKCVLEPVNTYTRYISDMSGLTDDEHRAFWHDSDNLSAAPAYRGRLFKNRACKKK